MKIFNHTMVTTRRQLASRVARKMDLDQDETVYKTVNLNHDCAIPVNPEEIVFE